MKNYRNLILILFVSFIFVITNPNIIHAASSSSSISSIPFVLYLPLGILAAAVIAWIATIIQRIRHKI